MADKRRALVGSSNLTLGGAERNHELNYLFTENTKIDKTERENLFKWFGAMWRESGKALGKRKLINIQTSWKEKAEKLSKFTASLMPEPRLGGDCWGNVCDLVKRDKWAFKDASKIVASKTAARIQFKSSIS